MAAVGGVACVGGGEAILVGVEREVEDGGEAGVGGSGEEMNVGGGGVGSRRGRRWTHPGRNLVMDLVDRLQTVAIAGARYDKATTSGVSCRSQADCGCGDYLCLRDLTVPARLRTKKSTCTFVPLSSQLFPVLSGSG